MELAADSALCPALHSSGDSSPFKSRALALSYSVLSRPSLALFPPYISDWEGCCLARPVSWSPRKWGALGRCPLIMPRGFLRTSSGQWCTPGGQGIAAPFPRSLRTSLGDRVVATGPQAFLTPFTQGWQRPWLSANFMEVGECGDGVLGASSEPLNSLPSPGR